MIKESKSIQDFLIYSIIIFRTSSSRRRGDTQTGNFLEILEFRMENLLTSAYILISPTTIPYFETSFTQLLHDEQFYHK